jgi:hypothetical protein
MQYFQNTADGKTWAFDDDIIIETDNGALVFRHERHGPLNKVPTTLRIHPDPSGLPEPKPVDPNPPARSNES